MSVAGDSDANDGLRDANRSTNCLGGQIPTLERP